MGRVSMSGLEKENKLSKGQHGQLCHLTRPVLASYADFECFHDFSLFGALMRVLDISDRDK